MNRYSNVIDAEAWEVAEDDGREPDVYGGRDDLASALSGSVQARVHRNPALHLAETVQQPGMSLTQAAFVGAAACVGYSMGKSPRSRVLLAGLLASCGAAIYEFGSSKGWCS